MRGRSAAEIRAALDEVGSMRRVRERISDAEIVALARHLGGEPKAAATPPSAPAADAAAYRYLGADKCVKCHRRQVRQWRHSLHALAHSEPVYDAYFIKASRDSGQALETFCARCHTPIGVHQGTIPFRKAPERPGDTAVSAVAAEGLGCDFCHTISGAEKLVNGGFVLQPGETKLGPYADSSSTFHQTKGSKLYRDSAYCGTCHNVTHPQNGIVLESTYTEWKQSPYAAEGVSCQDCHMTAGLTERVARKGQAASDGPEREHVSDHMFVGPNVLFASSKKAAAELRKLSLELLRRAGEVEIGTIDRHNGALRLSIRVTNSGAGHGLPTGVTEIRQMWLEVKIVDARGKAVMHSGALDRQGNLDAQAIKYTTDVKDSSGRITSQFWNAVEKVRDHRIAARETVTEYLTLPPQAQSAEGELEVTVALRYRSVTPAGLREVGAPADLVAIPVLTIAEAKRSLKLP